MSKRREKAHKRRVERKKVRSASLALYALNQMPQSLRNDILSMRGPEELKQITSTSTTTIGSHSVPRTLLFATFRAALQSGTPQRMAMKGAEANVVVESGGDCTVKVGPNRHRIRNVDLASEDAGIRQAAIARMIAETPLSSATLKDMCRQSATSLSEEQFFEFLTAYAHSPAQVSSEFQDAVQSGKVSLETLFRPDVDYLMTLLPSPSTSSTLSEFVAEELDSELKARFESEADQAFVAQTRLFAARAIVRASSFQALPREKQKSLLVSLAGSANPYALVGAVEICAARVQEDPALGPIGLQLLQSFADRLPKFMASLEVYATAFCVANARLRTHTTFRDRPAYWRRLAATAHASVILEASAEGVPEPKGLLKWAMGYIGSQYFLAAALDKTHQPRWQAEWIEPRTLLADLIGRLRGCEELGLEGWERPLDKLRKFLVDENLQLQAVLPSIMEAELPVTTKPVREAPEFEEFVTEAGKENAPEALLRLQSVTYGWILLDELPALALGCMQRVIREAGSVEDTKILAVIRFAADAAVLAGDEALAEASAEALLCASHDLKEDPPLTEIIATLAECSNVLSEGDRTDRLVSWTMRLVRSQSDPNVLFHIRRELAYLSEMSAVLRPKLARVIAFASLGIT